MTVLAPRYGHFVRWMRHRFLMAPRMGRTDPLPPWDWKPGAFTSLCLTLSVMVSGCATTFSPTPIDDVPFKTRAQIQTKGDLTVTAAVPTSEEANAIYGVDLASKEIQPVWIEVENAGTAPYWFLPSGLDAAYFSAAEAAYAFDSSPSGGGSLVYRRNARVHVFRTEAAFAL